MKFLKHKFLIRKSAYLKHKISQTQFRCSQMSQTLLDFCLQLSPTLNLLNPFPTYKASQLLHFTLQYIPFFFVFINFSIKNSHFRKVPSLLCCSLVFVIHSDFSFRQELENCLGLIYILPLAIAIPLSISVSITKCAFAMK